MSADIAATMSMDTSGFVEPIERATAVVATAGEQTIRVIHEQQTSWVSMAASAVPAVATVTAATLNYAGTMATIGAGTAVLSSVNSSWGSAGAAVLRFGGLVNSVARTLIPQWRIAGLVVGGALLAYKAATSDMAESAVHSVAASNNVSAAVERLKTATGGLGEALAAPFKGGASVAEAFGAAVNTYVTQPLTNIASTVVVGSLDAITASIEGVGNAATVATDGITAFALALAADNADALAGYYAEAEALRELAKETERLTALQVTRGAAARSLAEIQSQAENAAATAADLHAIGLAKTAGEIDLIRNEYQQLFAAQANSLAVGEQLTQEQLKYASAIKNAIEAQAGGIASGRIRPDEAQSSGGSFEDEEQVKSLKSVEAAIETAQQKLNTLEFGEKAVAVATALTNGATGEQAAKLHELLTSVEQVTAAKQAQKEAEDAAARSAKEAANAAQRAADEQARLQAQGADKIAHLKDQIDLLNGAATKGEIAMREMLRNGMSEAQAKEVKELTDKLEGLQDAKNNKGGAAKDNGIVAGGLKSNTAALIGTSEAAKMAVGGTQLTKLEQLATQQLAVAKAGNLWLKDINGNVIDIKPPPGKGL